MSERFYDNDILNQNKLTNLPWNLAMDFVRDFVGGLYYWDFVQGSWPGDLSVGIVRGYSLRIMFGGIVLGYCPGVLSPGHYVRRYYLGVLSEEWSGGIVQRHYPEVLSRYFCLDVLSIRFHPGGIVLGFGLMVFGPGLLSLGFLGDGFV